jgi:RNA polymerase sigma-70 factor, ECF subfamily
MQSKSAMTALSDPKDDIVAAIPKLRAFAISLCGRTSLADDLVQETLMRALDKINSFEPGTNLMAWLYTILRHAFYTDIRKRKRDVADPDDVYSAKLTTPADQEAHIEFLDFSRAFAALSLEHREALVLVGASGLSYEDAAQICKCPVGTMKSRVNRARSRLAELLPGYANKPSAPAQPTPIP